MSIKKLKGLNGPTGLVSSVIAQAVADATRGKPADRADALRYLRSTTYKKHLTMIDKPTDWLPQDQD